MASAKRAVWGVVVRLANGRQLFYSPGSGPTGAGRLESSRVSRALIRQRWRSRRGGGSVHDQRAGSGVSGDPVGVTGRSLIGRSAPGQRQIRLCQRWGGCWAAVRSSHGRTRPIATA